MAGPKQMDLPLCSSLSPCLLGSLAFGAREDSEVGSREQPLGLADLQRGQVKGRGAEGSEGSRARRARRARGGHAALFPGGALSIAVLMATHVGPAGPRCPSQAAESPGGPGLPWPCKGTECRLRGFWGLGPEGHVTGGSRLQNMPEVALT